MIWKTRQFLLLSILAGTVLSVAPVNAMFAGDERDGAHALASTSAARPNPSRRVAAVQQKFETLQATEPNAGLIVRTLIQSMEPYANRIHDPAYQTASALNALWRSQKDKTITFDVARQKALQFFNEINSVTLAKSFVKKLEELNQGLPAHKQIDTSFVNVTGTSSVAGGAASGTSPSVALRVSAPQNSASTSTATVHAVSDAIFQRVQERQRESEEHLNTLIVNAAAAFPNVRFPNPTLASQNATASSHTSRTARVSTAPAVQPTVSNRSLPVTTSITQSRPAAAASSNSAPEQDFSDFMREHRERMRAVEERDREHEREMARMREKRLQEELKEARRPRPVRPAISIREQESLRDPMNPAGLPHLLRDIQVDALQSAEQQSRSEYLAKKALEAVFSSRPTNEYDVALPIFAEGFQREDMLRRGDDFRAGEVAAVKEGIIRILSQAAAHQRRDFQEHYRESLKFLGEMDAILPAIQSIQDVRQINTHTALMEGLFWANAHVSDRTRNALEARQFPIDYSFEDARNELLRLFNGLDFERKMVCANMFSLTSQNNQNLPLPVHHEPITSDDA